MGRDEESKRERNGGPSWECLIELPDMLRAYIPYAHTRAGVRDDLTAEALETIDDLRLTYQRLVLSERAELVDADYCRLFEAPNGGGELVY